MLIIESCMAMFKYGINKLKRLNVSALTMTKLALLLIYQCIIHKNC